MSRSDQTSTSPSSSQESQRVRELAFFTGLTFVLEPKQKSITPSSKSLQNVTSQLGVDATPTKDPRSKNYWVQVAEGTQAVKIRRLLKKKSDFGDFTVREIYPDSAEETRVRRHITGQLALADGLKPDPDEVEPFTSNDGTDQEAGTSRLIEKRNAARAFADMGEAPAAVLESSAPPEAPVVERPRKQVKFDLRLNTYQHFEDQDSPEPLPSSRSVLRAVPKPPTIDKLPPTCLQSIFVYGTPDPVTASAKTYRRALYSLMLVCSKWKSAAGSAPSLWSHLSNANPPRMIDACIQRSSGTVITVKFDGSMEYPNMVQSALERFMDKAVPHRLRWSSVWFSNVPPTWNSYLAIARAFNGPAPALTSAKVTTIYGTTMPFVHSLRLFGGDAQALRHVTLTGIVPDLSDVPVFTNIESLRIIRPMGISPAYVLRMLARNNKLRTLELVEVRPSYARLFQNIETLELPELLHFKLHLLNENTIEMAQLFTRLRAPKCRRLDLAIDIDHLKNLRLEFNMLEFDMEAFLVDLGSWMSNWMALNRASSVEAWVDPTPGGESSKPTFCWQYGGAFNGSYRSRSADVRLEVENRRTKQIISRWAEDVKLHAELVEAGVRRGAGLARMESFHSYRKRLIKDRESENPEDGVQPHEFMGIWDLRNQANR
ncbi:hypothetical protein M407DRAFT_227839 [Tulasnella calospora MUT 4182]|uniref:F-box domain-containing protein n=1 Tax=Tulasnella calospora MUT 4182 TaxID=1051891 RepID=A0A0C3QN25_9AGAM|nr:hypothetical protein M407DRAFT_227839 [Tulasnella calospora MUT 4182]